MTKFANFYLTRLMQIKCQTILGSMGMLLACLLTSLSLPVPVSVPVTVSQLSLRLN